MTQKQTASQPVRAAALICEYNPFHNGHAAQLAMLRRAYPQSPADISIRKPRDHPDML